jgi:Ion transport protein
MMTSKFQDDFVFLLSVECSERHICEGLSKHAHFRNFGMAFLTLFRVATGDNWNGIMKVMLPTDVNSRTKQVDCINYVVNENNRGENC